MGLGELIIEQDKGKHIPVLSIGNPTVRISALCVGLKFGDELTWQFTPISGPDKATCSLAR